MPELPTLIILAESESRHMADGPRFATVTSAHESGGALDTVHHTIRKGLASGLQVLLVAPPMVAAQALGPVCRAGTGPVGFAQRADW